MNDIDDDQVLEGIISWIKTRCPENDVDIRHDTRLLDMSLLDSMDLLEMVTYIEERYDISVDPDDLVPGNFESPRRIVELVAKGHQ
jgi:acyl carrier protein